MIRPPLNWRWRLGLGALAFVLLALAYSYLSYRQHVRNPNDTTVPNAAQLWEGVEMVLRPRPSDNDRSWIATDTWASLSRLAVGLSLSILLGTLLGVAMGCFHTVEALLLPLISFLAKIPPPAMMAVFFILVGIDFNFFVITIVFGVVPITAQSIYQSVRKDVPEELIYKAYTLGASTIELIWDVIFRQVLPRVIETARLQIGPALVYLIAAEYANSEPGFGYRLRMCVRLSQMNVIYIYVIYLGLLGLAFDSLLTWIRRKTCPWYGA